MKTIGFIGGGRITKILLQALKNANITFEKTVIFDINEGALNNLKIKFPQISISAKIADVVNSELIILAIHFLYFLLLLLGMTNLSQVLI